MGDTELPEHLRIRSETLDRISDGVVALDEDLRYTYVNERAEYLLGRDDDDLRGAHIRDAFPDAKDTVVEDIERATERGEHESFERYDHDLERWFRIRVYPDERGVSIFFTDITERKSKRRVLERAETLFRNAQDALFLVDVGERFRLERVNPAYEQLTGLSDDELGGKTLREAFGEEDGAAIEARYRDCVERREPLEYEEQLSVPEPESYWETRIAPVVVDDEVVQLVGATRDITERKRRERELEDQRDNLELLNQMMSHDIRNDLQLVSAYAEMLEGHVDEGGTEYLDFVRTSAESAVELTKTARDLSEAMLSTGDRARPVPLWSTLETQIEETRATYRNAAITVEGEVADVDVLADDMLASAFRNLLKNAVQHNDKPVPEVRVGVETDADTAVVRIADNGPGVPDDRKETVFGRGEKGLDSEGAGIGLYLVRTLVEQYGGAVGVEDNDPEGAVFVLELLRATTGG